MFKKCIFISLLVLSLGQVQAAEIVNPIEIPQGAVLGTIMIASTALHLYGVHKFVDCLEKKGTISSNTAFYIKSYDKGRSALLVLWALSHFSNRIPFRISGGMPFWMEALGAVVIVNTPLFELTLPSVVTDIASMISKVPGCAVGIFEAAKDAVSRIRIV